MELGISLAQAKIKVKSAIIDSTGNIMYNVRQESAAVACGSLGFQGMDKVYLCSGDGWFAAIGGLYRVISCVKGKKKEVQKNERISLCAK
ncbi:MAG: hypothetical protein IJZ91_04615 [Oscillospiraceae bacterium]|nr:hypothetical protein [Oscillospiraceae bacterium]